VFITTALLTVLFMFRNHKAASIATHLLLRRQYLVYKQHTLDLCLQRWEEKQQRFLQRSKLLAHLDLFNSHIPEAWDCEVEDVVGTKVLCFRDLFVRDQDCMFVSIAHDADTRFEDDLLAINPGCQVDMFDCRLDPEDMDHRAFLESLPTLSLNFHNTCLGASDVDSFASLPTILDLTSKHGKITGLKIDCIECDDSMLLNGLERYNDKTLPIDHLLIQIQSSSSPRLQELLSRMNELGLRLYEVQSILEGCQDSYTCLELEFIAARAAFQAHIHHFCPSFDHLWSDLCSRQAVPGCPFESR